MKGVHLTEFVAFAEPRYSLQTAAVKQATHGLPSVGVYTYVGIDAHDKLMELTHRLSRFAFALISQPFLGAGLYLYKWLAAGHYADRLMLPNKSTRGFVNLLQRLIRGHAEQFSDDIIINRDDNVTLRGLAHASG